MAKLPSGNRKYQIKELWDRHHEINRRILLGQKNKEIAEDLNISEATVSYTKNSKLAQDELNVLKAARDASSVDVARQIKEIAPRALEVLEEVMEGDDSSYYVEKDGFTLQGGIWPGTLGGEYFKDFNLYDDDDDTKGISVTGM